MHRCKLKFIFQDKTFLITLSWKCIRKYLVYEKICKKNIVLINLKNIFTVTYITIATFDQFGNLVCLQNWSGKFMFYVSI